MFFNYQGQPDNSLALRIPDCGCPHGNPMRVCKNWMGLKCWLTKCLAEWEGPVGATKPSSQTRAIKTRSWVDAQIIAMLEVGHTYTRYVDAPQKIDRDEGHMVRIWEGVQTAPHPSRIVRSMSARSGLPITVRKVFDEVKQVGARVR